jgi:hypothetical protein
MGFRYNSRSTAPVQQTQDQAQARGVFRLDLAVTSLAEVLRESLVPEALDHAYGITIVVNDLQPIRLFCPVLCPWD